VSLMAILLMVVGGVLTAFLYPRSVVVDVLFINTTKINNDSSINQSTLHYDVLLGVKVRLIPIHLMLATVCKLL